MEAVKRRLTGDTARAATTDEVKDLRRESTALKEVVAEQALEIRLLKRAGPPGALTIQRQAHSRRFPVFVRHGATGRFGC